MKLISPRPGRRGIAISPSGHQAVLKCRRRAQLLDQEQAPNQEHQHNHDAD
jgi:hypothetical protein